MYAYLGPIRGPNAARQQQLSTDILDIARPQQQTRRPPPLLLLSMNGTFDRSMTLSAYYAGRIMMAQVT